MTELFRSALNYISSSQNQSGSQSSEFVGQIIELGHLRLNIRRVLAEGGFAFIFLAADQKGIEYALKRLLVADKEGNDAVIREINFLKQLSGHPNVVCCIQAASVGKDEYNMGRNEYLILMEYCKNGPLVEILRGLAEPLSCEQITKIFYQTCRAVLHMHSQKPPIIHFDLKTIKLCDFSSATCNTFSPDHSWSAQQRGIVEEELARRTTPMYRAPEMLDLYQNLPINEKVDIWALGCVLYYLCYLQHPFEDSAKLRIINAKYTLPSNGSRYSVFHDLILVTIHQRSPLLWCGLYL
uniref:Protein kinase domain-containing protein n=1 Tax=Romanomermis culicivorax TaxID=13658 RepID=A0A915JAG3_ROMCU